MFDNVLSSMSFVDMFNVAVMIIFTMLYSYQIFYVLEVLIKKRTVRDDDDNVENHKFAVMIAARNEEKTIGNLLHSISVQSYPSNLIDVFVIADNCNDSTAEIARTMGATVYERHNNELVGKGYALDYGYKMITSTRGIDAYDAYMVFDADNIIDMHFFEAMNRTLDSGACASTSYRNSKNFTSNWISAGYGLWFIREAKFLSQARQDLGTSCAISGTGFYIRADVLAESGGWKWNLLTEDIQFSADSVSQGRRIAYTPDAVLYDEQPTTFKDSWNQRERWAKGFYQVFARYGAKLLHGMLFGKHGTRFACYDMLMTIAPGMLLTVIALAMNIAIVALGALGVMSTGSMVASALTSATFCILNYALFMFMLGAITMFVEWDKVHGSTMMKIKSMFTFPLFMLTYIPIAIVALFKRPQWKPITHSVSLSIEEIENGENVNDTVKKNVA